MLILKSVFQYLAYVSMWKPMSLQTFKENFLFKIYQIIWGIFHFIFTVLMVYTVVKLVFIGNQYSKYYQTVYIMPITALLFFKFLYVNYKREELIDLVNYFESEEFKAANDEEKELDEKYEKISR